MKKYGLITVLSLSCISHATAQDSLGADEYYKKALANTQKLDAAKSETAEAIYESATTTAKEIEKISNKLATATAEELPKLQAQLSLFQATLQANAVKLKALNMIQAKDTKTREELREEQAQKQHQELEKQLKEKLETTKTGIDN